MSTVSSLWLQAGAALQITLSELASLLAPLSLKGLLGQGRRLDTSSKAHDWNTHKELLHEEP